MKCLLLLLLLLIVVIADVTFGNFMITPFLQSSGTHFSFQQLFMRLVSAPIVLRSPCFSSFADISSSLAALLFFSALIAFSVSSSVMSAMFTGRSLGMDSVSKANVIRGSGWFNTSLKCSTQREFCSSCVSRTLPFLSLMGAVELLFAPARSLTTRNRVLVSLCLAASSASVPFRFNHSLLSVLQLFSPVDLVLCIWL